MTLFTIQFIIIFIFFSYIWLRDGAGQEDTHQETNYFSIIV